MEQQQRQEQVQKASQALIQQMQVLQMTTLQLEHYLCEVYLDNPMLELSPVEPPRGKDARPTGEQWSARHDEQNPFDRINRRVESGSPGENGLEPPAREQGGLSEHLIQQLDRPHSSGMKGKICRYVVHSLNHRGYFPEPSHCAAAYLGATEAEVEQCVAYLQTLDPPGICARDLSECLRLQLERKGGDLKLEMAIVTQHLELLGKNQLHTIAKRLKVPVSRIVRAKELIQTLNPSPGAGFPDGMPVDYITPDMIVTRKDDGFLLFVNQGELPRIQVDPRYMELYQSGACDEETRRYLTGKLRQVNSLRQHLESRGTTLEKLGRYLLEYQQEFFLRGDGFLRPLRMQDAAEALGLSKSTICRAVKGKFLQCPHGTFPLSHFFSKAVLAGTENELLATEGVMLVLKDIIEREDGKNPLSDQELCAQLALRGLDISRRTVAKYRERMGIPDSRGRKQF